MKTGLHSILINDGKVSEEDAKNIGVQTGITIIGALVHSGFLRFTSKSIAAMKDSEHYEAFVSTMFDQIELGCQQGMEGMKARAAMALNLQEGLIAMRKALYEASLHNDGKNLELLDSLLETSEIVEKTANALLEPIEGSIRQFVEVGQRSKLAAVAFGAQAQSRGCSNPNCEKCHKDPEDLVIN